MDITEIEKSANLTLEDILIHGDLPFVFYYIFDFQLIIII